MNILFEVLSVFFQIFKALMDTILQIIVNLPINKMSLIKALVDDSIRITSIQWIDDALLVVAGLVPPAVIGLISSKLKIRFDGRTIIFLLLVLYAVTILLFQSLVFWIIVGCLLAFLAILLLAFNGRMGIGED